MHTEKQRIFNEYAKSEGFEDWDHLLIDFECKLMTIDEFEYFMFEACDLVQQEQQNIIADKAELNFHDGYWKTDKRLKYYQIGADNIQVDKDSILNPENLIQ